MNWIHFIGKSYYTPKSFIEEAQSHGVNRRVSLRILSGFSWGDRIFLAFGDFKTSRRKAELKKSLVIGYFDVQGLGGITPKAAQDLREKFGGRLISRGGGGVPVSRRCGGYSVVGTLRLLEKVSLRDVAHFLHEGEDSLPGLSLRGGFVPINPPVEISLTFRFGYTKIDSEKCPELSPFLVSGTGSIVSMSEIVEEYFLRDLWGSGKTAW